MSRRGKQNIGHPPQKPQTKGARLLSNRLKNRSSGLYVIAPDGSAITCGVCGFTSTDPRHVREKYCPACHTFHEDHELMMRLSEGYQKRLDSHVRDWLRFKVAA